MVIITHTVTDLIQEGKEENRNRYAHLKSSSISETSLVMRSTRPSSEGSNPDDITAVAW